tara:strand:- start:7931 stop:8284 length:354 start_codon:yes stop_codon:yes gene_type:complete
MAKQIIILERVDEPSDLNFRYALWATVPAARVSAYANASATSAYRDASAPEIAAIQAGQIVEQVDKATFAVGTPLGQIQTDLIRRFNVFQGQINAKNPNGRYGTFWDGASWTAGGTA